MTNLVPFYLKNAYCGRETRWNILSIEVSLRQLAARQRHKTSWQKLARRLSFCPLLMSMLEALSLLHFNKILLLKTSGRSSLNTGHGLNSSSQQAKNSGVFHSSSTTFTSSLLSFSSLLIMYITLWVNTYSIIEMLSFPYVFVERIF